MCLERSDAQMPTALQWQHQGRWAPWGPAWCLPPGQWTGGLPSKSPRVLVSHSVVWDSADPTDCSPPGFSVHGILQARILEWVAISFSRGSSDPGIEPTSPALQVDSLLSEPPASLRTDPDFPESPPPPSTPRPGGGGGRGNPHFPRGACLSRASLLLK